MLEELFFSFFFSPHFPTKVNWANNLFCWLSLHLIPPTVKKIHLLGIPASFSYSCGLNLNPVCFKSFLRKNFQVIKWLLKENKTSYKKVPNLVEKSSIITPLSLGYQPSYFPREGKDSLFTPDTSVSLLSVQILHLCTVPVKSYLVWENVNIFDGTAINSCIKLALSCSFHSSDPANWRSYRFKSRTFRSQLSPLNPPTFPRKEKMHPSPLYLYLPDISVSHCQFR